MRRAAERTLVALLTVGVAAAVLVSRGQSDVRSRPSGRAEANWTKLVGWYRLDSGRDALLSWAADGDLRLAALQEPFLSQPLQQRDDESLLWTPSERAPRSVRFRFDADDRVLGFDWTDEEDGTGSAERLPRQPYSLRELEYENGAVRLSGTLLLPSADGPVPAAAMIHGSGDSDRDNLWYLVIADHLAKDGIAVLLPDKRGCGKSGGDWRTSGMRDFAADAHTSVRALQALSSIDSRRVGFLGISQGGRIAPLAASSMDDLAFVVNLSGGVLPVNESLLHESRQTLRQQGMPGWMADGFGPFAAAVAKLRNPVWWEKNGNYDPMPHWRSLEVPGLVVYGADDERDNVPVSRSVALLEEISGSVDLTVRVYPDSGHGLFVPGTRTIRPEALALLSRWIRDAVDGASG